MIEHEQIWLDWEQGKRAAIAVSGQPAVVCIMGWQTYSAFRAALTPKERGFAPFRRIGATTQTPIGAGIASNR